jgi:hypothetical protein
MLQVRVLKGVDAPFETISFHSRFLGLELNPNLNNELQTNRDLTPK